MLTCFIKYVVDPNKRKDFIEYAKTWVKLIEKYGGVHHGYFSPMKDKKDESSSSFSFSKIGKKGPDNIAVALFSFSNLEKYETFRKEVQNDEECQYITERFKETSCFVNYERSFLEPLLQNMDDKFFEN